MSIPKGGQEEGDCSPVGTALREWEEETNLPRSGLALLNRANPLLLGTGDSRSMLIFVGLSSDEDVNDIHVWPITEGPG